MSDYSGDSCIVLGSSPLSSPRSPRSSIVYSSPSSVSLRSSPKFVTDSEAEMAPTSPSFETESKRKVKTKKISPKIINSDSEEEINDENTSKDAPPIIHSMSKRSGTVQQTVQCIEKHIDRLEMARRILQEPQQLQDQNQVVGENENVINVNVNGSIVKKMAVILNGHTVWVDCDPNLAQVPSQDVQMVNLDNDNSKQNKNTVTDDLDLNSTSTRTSEENAQNQTEIATPNQSNKSKYEYSWFASDQKREAIIKECIEGLISPTELSGRHNISEHVIRTWVKNAGLKLPSEYDTIHRYDSQNIPTEYNSNYSQSLSTPTLSLVKEFLKHSSNDNVSTLKNSNLVTTTTNSRPCKKASKDQRPSTSQTASQLENDVSVEEDCSTPICHMCLQSLEDAYMLNCGHLGFCDMCSNNVIKKKSPKVPKCPLCGKKVKSRQKVFLNIKYKKRKSNKDCQNVITIN